MASVEELKQDCEELQKLLKIASRSNVRQLIASEITGLQNKIHQLEEEHKKNDDSKANETNVAQIQEPKEEKPAASHVFTQKIQSYGWDQTEKSIKIYISLKGVENVAHENIKLDAKSDSFELLITNLDKKNHHLQISRLLESIEPAGCSFKAKSGNIILTLKKSVAQKWSHLTKTEKSKSDATAPKLDKDEDPSSSIMKMMKQMYDEGDDEMKRTIAKAWTESRDKQSSGNMDLGI